MLRAFELQTLDAMERRWLPLALHPALDVSTKKGKASIGLPAYGAGLKAVDRVLKIHERRAKLLGLDMPEKQEHSGKVVHRHLTLAEFRERIAQSEKWEKEREDAAARWEK